MATRSRKEHYEIRSGRNNGRAVSYACGVECDVERPAPKLGGWIFHVPMCPVHQMVNLPKRLICIEAENVAPMESTERPVSMVSFRWASAVFLDSFTLTHRKLTI